MCSLKPTGVPGFPGTERGGMLGLLPGGGGIVDATGAGPGEGGAIMGVAFGFGVNFKTFNASLLEPK